DDEKEKIAAVLYQLRWKSPEAKRALMKDIHTQHHAPLLHVQYALGNLSHDVCAVDALLDNTGTDSSPLFRDKAACALAYDQVHLIPRQKIHLFERLIGALSNPKLQVRQIALQALQIHTGQTRGFVPSAPEAERARQIESWRRSPEASRSNLSRPRRSPASAWRERRPRRSPPRARSSSATASTTVPWRPVPTRCRSSSTPAERCASRGPGGGAARPRSRSATWPVTATFPSSKATSRRFPTARSTPTSRC